MTIKFKNLLFASLIAIPVSLVSCNNGEKKEECDHRWSDYTCLDETYHHHVCEKCGEDVKEEHTFSNPVVTVEPTCCTEGAQVCVCSVCGYDKVESIPATGVHEYNQTVVLPDGSNLVAEATCEHPAIYYKTCACGEFKKEEGALTFESGEALKHTIASLTTDGKLIKTNYNAFEQFDPDGLTFKAHCSECDKDLIIPAKDIVFSYDNGGSSFAVGETKVTANYYGKASDINGLTVSKAANEILGMENQNVHCGDKVVFAPYAKFDKDAKIKVEVKDKDDNVINPTAENAFNAAGSPYTATATLTGTDDYDGDTEDCRINVTHPTKEWVTDNFYDKLVCPKCGEVERSFRTQVDANFDFESTASATLDFSNLSSDSTDYKVYNSEDVEITAPITVSRDEYFPTLPDAAQVDEITEKYYAIEEESGKKHDINVSFNIVDHILKDEATFKTVNSTSEQLKGYYIVDNDITFSDTNWATGSSWGPNGFYGTLDGRGYTVDNIHTSGCGIFSYTGLNGCCKNINFTKVVLGLHINSTPNGFAPLLSRVNGATAFTVDNITAQFVSVNKGNYTTKSETLDGNAYLCCRTGTNNFKVTNSTFDLSAIEGGVMYGLGLWHACKRIGGDLNNKVYLKSYDSLGWDVLPTPNDPSFVELASIEKEKWDLIIVS